MVTANDHDTFVQEFYHQIVNIYFFLNVRVGGILRILQYVVLKHPLVIRGIGLLSGGISLALTCIVARGRHTYTHALMAAVINGSYHCNGNSAGPKYGCFRSSSWATYLHTKNEWGVSRSAIL